MYMICSTLLLALGKAAILLISIWKFNIDRVVNGSKSLSTSYQNQLLSYKPLYLYRIYLDILFKTISFRLA